MHDRNGFGIARVHEHPGQNPGLLLVVTLAIALLAGPVLAAGEAEMAERWTVFGPVAKDAPPLSADQLREVPDALRVGEETLKPQGVKPGADGRQELTPVLGSTAVGRTAFVFIPLEVTRSGKITLGFGADWWIKAYLDGRPILDTYETGNRREGRAMSPPSRRDFTVSVDLEEGEHLVVIRFSRGRASAMLAAGVLDEARRAAQRPTHWEIDDPLFEELLSERPQPIPGESAVVWPYALEHVDLGHKGVGNLRKFALQYGMRYTVDDVLERYAEHRMHPSLNASRLRRRFDRWNPYLRDWMRRTGIGMVVSVNQGWFLFGPHAENGLSSAREALRRYGEVTWGIFTGDERIRHHEQRFMLALRDNDPKLLRKYPAFRRRAERIRTPYYEQAAATVRRRFGDGRFGPPSAFYGTEDEPYRWLAFRRWFMSRVVDFQRRLYRLAQEHSGMGNEPPLVIAEDSRSGGAVRIDHLSRQAEWADLFPLQTRSRPSPHRQSVAYKTKIYADLTGKPVWPCVHVDTHQGVLSVEETNDLLSQVVRAGGSGLFYWPRDQKGWVRGKNDTKIDFYGHPGRYRVLTSAIDHMRTMNRPRLPEPDFAMFLSNDHLMTLGESPRYRRNEVPFTFFGPMARAWFRYISDIQVADGKVALADWLVILLMKSTVERRAVSKRFLRYPRDGRVLVSMFPDPFLKGLHGEDTGEIHRELFGVNLGEARTPARIQLIDVPQWLPGYEGAHTLSVAGATARTLDPDEGTRVLATYENGSPAIVEKSHPDGGRAILFAFETGLNRLSDAQWQRFYAAFARGLGIRTGRDIWRLQLPMPAINPPDHEPGEPACLTGNDFIWWENEVRTEGNRRIEGGAYRYSRPPAAPAEQHASGDSIAFERGDLTDRLDAPEAGNVENPRGRRHTEVLSLDQFIVGWEKPGPVHVTFDLTKRCDLARLRLVYSGHLPGLTVVVSDDGNSWEQIAAAPAHHPTEDVPDLVVDLKGASALYLRLAIPQRSPGERLLLSEIEIWGTPAQE